MNGAAGMNDDNCGKWERLFPMISESPAHQFAIWAAQHSAKTIRHGLVTTAVKNVQLNSVMNQDYAVRFASSVMNRLTQTQETK